MLAPPRVSQRDLIVDGPFELMRRAIQMGTLLTSARRAVKALGPRGKTTRVPEGVRVVVLAYAREARSTGESWAGIAENVELSQTALQRWHSKGPRKLVRVVVELLCSEVVDLVPFGTKSSDHSRLSFVAPR